MTNFSTVICNALVFIYVYEMELSQHGIELRNGTCHSVVENAEQFAPLIYLNEQQQVDVYSRTGEPVELCVFTHADVQAITRYRKRMSQVKYRLYAKYTRKEGPLVHLLYSIGLVHPHLSHPSGHMCVYFYPWYPPLLYPKYFIYPFK